MNSRRPTSPLAFLLLQDQFCGSGTQLKSLNSEFFLLRVSLRLEVLARLQELFSPVCLQKEFSPSLPTWLRLGHALMALTPLVSAEDRVSMGADCKPSLTPTHPHPHTPTPPTLTHPHIHTPTHTPTLTHTSAFLTPGSASHGMHENWTENYLLTKFDQSISQTARDAREL